MHFINEFKYKFNFICILSLINGFIIDKYIEEKKITYYCMHIYVDTFKLDFKCILLFIDNLRKKIFLRIKKDRERDIKRRETHKEKERDREADR